MTQRRSSSTLVTIGWSVVAVLGVYSTISWYRNQRKCRQAQKDARDEPHSDGASNLPAMTMLERFFLDASTEVKSMKNLGQGDQLMLYGLYKQATEGDFNDKGAPSKLNIVAYAKHTSWGKFAGISKQAAMVNYIQAAKHFQQQGGSDPQALADENADIVYDEDDEEEIDYDNDDDDTNGKSDYDPLNGGMSMKPSTLASTSEDENDATPADISNMSLAQKLRHAASQNDMDLLKSCLEEHTKTSESSSEETEGNNLDVRDEIGQSALHFAADRNSLEVLETLIKNGANVNSADVEGISVLQAAVIAGHVDAAKLLLQNGADPDHEDLDGDTPRSCAKDDSTEEIKELFNNIPVPRRKIF
jgi:acyl-CoA-binding protein